MYKFRGREGEHEDRDRDLDDDLVHQAKPGARTLTQGLARPSESALAETWLDGRPFADTTKRRTRIIAVENADAASSRFGDLTRLRAMLEKLASGGVPLPETIMSRFATLLGADLSAVRIHASGAASDATAELGARALTHGSHIAFAPGAYDEAHADRDHVLAHELVHVVQNQRSGGAAMQLAARLDVGPSGSAIESEAEAGAHALTSGRAFSVATRGNLPGISLFDGPGPAPAPGPAPEAKAPAPSTPPDATAAAPAPGATVAPPAGAVDPNAAVIAPAPAPAPAPATAAPAPAAAPVTTAGPTIGPAPGAVDPSAAVAPKVAPPPATAAAIDGRVAELLEQRADPKSKAEYTQVIEGVNILRIQAFQYTFPKSGFLHTLGQFVVPTDAFKDHFAEMWSANPYRGGSDGMKLGDRIQAGIEMLRGVLHIIGDVAGTISGLAGMLAAASAVLALVTSPTLFGAVGFGAVAAALDAVATLTALVKILLDAVDALLSLAQMVALALRARCTDDPAQRARLAAMIKKESGDFASNVLGIALQAVVIVATAGTGGAVARTAEKGFLKSFGKELEGLTTGPIKAFKNKGIESITEKFAVHEAGKGIGTGIATGGRKVLGVEVEEGLVQLDRNLRVGNRITSAREVLEFDKVNPITKNQMNGAKLKQVDTALKRFAGKGITGTAGTIGSGQLVVESHEPAGAGGGPGVKAAESKPGKAASLTTVQMWPSQIERFEAAKAPLADAKEHAEEQLANAKDQLGATKSPEVEEKIKAAMALQKQQAEVAKKVATDAKTGSGTSTTTATVAGQGAKVTTQTQETAGKMGGPTQNLDGQSSKLTPPAPKEGLLGKAYNWVVGKIGAAFNGIQTWIKNLVGKMMMMLGGFTKDELDMAGVENGMRTDAKKDDDSKAQATAAAAEAGPVQQKIYELQKDQSLDEQNAIQGIADSLQWVDALEEAEATLAQAITDGNQYMADAAAIIAHEVDTQKAGKSIDAGYVAPITSFADAFVGSLADTTTGARAKAQGESQLAQMKAVLPDLDTSWGETQFTKAASDYQTSYDAFAESARAGAVKLKSATQAFVGTTDYGGCSANAAALDKLDSDFSLAANALYQKLYDDINYALNEYFHAIDEAVRAAQATPIDLTTPPVDDGPSIGPAKTGGLHLGGRHGRLSGDFTPAPANGMGSPTPPPPPQPGAAGALTINSVATAGASAGGAGADRTVVGIGEEVTFSSAGGESGTWTVDGGTPATASGDKLVWSAPATAGNFTIKLTVGDKTATKAMSSILPTSVKFAKTNDWGPDADWMMGAGMDLDMELQPLTVSFTKISIREQPGGASNLSGYFTGSVGDISHHPTDGATLIRNNNKAGSYDEAHLSDATGDLWPRPLSVGSMTWSIPYLFTAAGAVDQPFSLVTQTMSIVDSKGTVTVSKSDQSTSRSPKGHPPKGAFAAPAGGAGGSHRIGGSIGGSALAPPVRAQMESAFGADFSAVRVHEDSQAEALDAQAFTRGSDIHFAPGRYNPSSGSGLELLGHELTHVVQQGQGRVGETVQTKGNSLNDDSALEREADTLGAAAARGERVGSFGGTFASGATVQRKVTVTPIPTAKLDRLTLIGDGTPAKPGLTISALQAYVARQADWFSEPSLTQVDRDTVWKVLLNFKGGATNVALGSLHTGEVAALAGASLAQLAKYAACYDTTKETIQLSTPAPTMARALQLGQAVIDLEAFVPTPVMRVVIPESGLIYLVDNAKIPELKSYYNLFHPTLETPGEWKYVEELLNETVATYAALVGWVTDLHIFTIAARTRLAANVADKSRSLPVLLILFSATDWNNAFMQASNLEASILNGKNLALVVQGMASLGAGAAMVTKVADDYGQQTSTWSWKTWSHVKSPGRLGQVVIAGHGSDQSAEMASPGTGARVEDDGGASTPRVEYDKTGVDSSDPVKNGTQLLIDTVLSRMDPKDANVVFAGCLVGSHSLAGTNVGNAATAQANLNAAVAAHPNLSDYVRQRMTAMGVTGTVQAANGSTTFDSFNVDGTGHAQLSNADDPHVGGTKLEYVQTGIEPQGALRAALECYGDPKIGPAKTTTEMRKHVGGLAGNAGWWQSMTRLGFELCLPPAPADMNVAMALDLSERIDVWFDSGWDNMINVQSLANAVVVAEAPKVFGAMLATAWGGQDHIAVGMREAWMQHDAAQAGPFMAALTASGLTRETFKRLLARGIVDPKLATLLPIGAPTKGQLLLALTIAALDGAGMPAAVRDFLRAAAGGARTSTFPAALAVGPLIAPVSELEILNNIGLGPAAAVGGGGPVTVDGNVDADHNKTNETFISVSPHQATVTASQLNIRKKPSAGSAIVGTAKTGDVLKVMGETADGWSFVDNLGKTGFVSSSFITAI